MEDERRRRKWIVVVLLLLLIFGIGLIAWHSSEEHRVTVEVVGEGTADPMDSIVDDGDSIEIVLKPEAGWHVASVTVNGKDVAIEGDVLKLEDISEDLCVKVVFERTPDSFVLETSSNNGGTVEPSGRTTHQAGEKVMVVITPDEGKVIDDVELDGVSMGSINIVDVVMDSDHVLEATFRDATDDDILVTIDVDVVVETTGAEYGSITPSGTVRVPRGGSLVIDISLNSGYFLDGLAVNGVPQSPETRFIIKDIQAQMDIDITLCHVVSSHIVTIESTGRGKVSPSGDVTVQHGGDLTMTFIPDSGYRLSSLEIDGKSVGTGFTTYTLKDVVSDHRARAVFSYIPTPDPGPVRTLTSITVASPPTSCYIGGSIDGTIPVTAHYSDGTVETKVGTCSPTSWNAPGTYDVIVSYGGKNCSFKIVVPELKSIEITTDPLKTVFAKGEAVSLTGMAVTARYTDGSYDRSVSAFTYSPDSFDAAGLNDVIISYSEGSSTKTAVLNVTVVDAGGFTATVISYSGTKVVDGKPMAFSESPNMALNEFSFDTSNIVPGISQTIRLRVHNDSGIDLNACVYVSGLTGDDVLAEQLRLSSGSDQASVKDAANGIFIELGAMEHGTEKTFDLSMTFVEGEDNNQAMGKALEFEIGVFAGQDATASGRTGTI